MRWTAERLRQQRLALRAGAAATAAASVAAVVGTTGEWAVVLPSVWGLLPSPRGYNRLDPTKAIAGCAVAEAAQARSNRGHLKRPRLPSRPAKPMVDAGGRNPTGESGAVTVSLGLALLCVKVLIGLNLLDKRGCWFLWDHPLLEHSISIAFALVILLLEELPGFLAKTEQAALKWLVGGTVTRGCPEWYKPFATSAIVEAVQRTLGTLQVYIAVSIIIHAVPRTWALSSRLAPHWLRFMDTDRDGFISGLEVEKHLDAIVPKILCAILSTHAGLMLLRLKDPKPGDVGYFVPREAREAQRGANMMWAPILRFIGTQRALQVGQHSWAHLVDKCVSVAIFASIAGPWLNVFGLQLRAVLTVGGVASLAVALAGKTLAQNLISGILIYVNKAIQPGLEVELMKLKLAGIVDTVGWFHTDLSLVDGNMVSVPNAEVLDGAVAHRSSKRVRVVDEEFMVSFSDPASLRHLVSAVQCLIMTDPDVLQEREIQQLKAKYHGRVYIYPPQCIVSGLCDHGVKLRLRAYFRSHLLGNQFLEARSRLLLAVNDQVCSMGGQVGLQVYNDPSRLGAAMSQLRRPPRMRTAAGKRPWQTVPDSGAELSAAEECSLLESGTQALGIDAG